MKPTLQCLAALPRPARPARPAAVAMLLLACGPPTVLDPVAATDSTTGPVSPTTGSPIPDVTGDGATVTSAGDGTSTGSPPGEICGLPALEDLATTPGPYAVETSTQLLVDRSRPTPAFGTHRGGPVRNLPTRVWRPAGAIGPQPLVIYAHGLGADGNDGAYLAEHWASYGYVVAAPDFPATKADAPGGYNVADVTAQPQDVAFVIDELVAASDDPRSALFELVDPDHVAVSGLSLGALTGLLMLAEDPRSVQSAILLATPGCLFPSSPLGPSLPPTIAIHGDADLITPFDPSTPPVLDAPSPVTFVVRLQGASHTGFSGVALRAAMGTAHPDVLGCSFLDPLGDIWGPVADAVGGDPGACPAPCQQPQPWPEPLPVPVQTDATRAISLIHLERTLRGCADADARWTILVDGAAAGVEVL